jgi:hypothetical protein
MSKKVLYLFLVFVFIGGCLSLFAQMQTPVDPLNWKELVPFLADINGWTALDDAEGQTVSMMNFKTTQVERGYEKGDMSLTVMIVDGGYAPMAYQSIKMAMNFEMDTSDEYLKKTEINGYPGFVKYTYEDKEAELMLLVADRFIFQMSGENMKDTSELVDIAKSFELGKLAKLAK